MIRRSDGTTDTFYVTTDHLGSTDAVLNAAGTVLMRGSFGVHGARRASNWQGTPSSTEWQAIADTTRRGYTGHEQIDNVMVVHMNGRAFDPVMGRFLSALSVHRRTGDHAGVESLRVRARPADERDGSVGI